MATWFAQNSSVNIDSVNQWNDAAGGGGSWLTWASLAAGDILVANGKTSITINVNVTCATLTTVATGGTAGGGFILAAGVTVTANVVAGTTTVIVRSGTGATSNIVGDVTGGAVTTAVGITLSAAATVTVTGTVTGGSVASAAYGCSNSAGTLQIVGNVTGGAGSRGVFCTGGTTTITGTVTGAASGSASGIGIGGNSTIQITGNVQASAGTGIDSTNSGFTSPLIVVGDLIASTTSPAMYSAAQSGNLLHCGDIVSGVNTKSIFSYVIYRVNSSAALEHQYRTYDPAVYSDLGSRTLYTGGISVGHPATADVRMATTFGAASEYTGTLAVPSPTLVAIGVATDNTVGSYSASGGLDAAGVRSAIGLASANLDTQLIAIQSDTNDIQTRLPATLESGRIAAAMDSTATAALVDLIWDEPLTGATHNVATSSGKRLRQTTAFQQIDSTVIDASATTTTFVTGLDSAVDNFYNDSMLVFTDGALAGQVRAIYDYIGATKTIILEEALTSVPVNGVAFTIVSLHIHPVSQIQSGLATSTALAAAKTILDKVDTGLVVDGAAYQFTANMLELAPSGGGAGDASQATLLEVKAKTDLIGTTSGISSLLAASVLTPGTITEFPDTLTIGDSYTTANGRSIQIPIVDTDGNQISSTGSLNFADATATFVIKRAKETDSTRIITGTAAFTDPVGTGTSGAPYAVVQLTSSETAKGLIGYKYSGVLTFTWPYVGTGTDPEVMSFETDTLLFDN
jgi:hypothetical protein